MECGSFQSVTHMAVNGLTNFRNNVKDWDTRDQSTFTAEEAKAFEEKPALLNRVVAQVGYALSSVAGMIETLVSSIIRLVLLPISYCGFTKVYNCVADWNESAKVSTAKSYACFYFNMVADKLPTGTELMKFVRNAVIA